MSDSKTSAGQKLEPKPSGLWEKVPLAERLSKRTDFESYAASACDGDQVWQPSRLLVSKSMADIRAAVSRSTLSDGSSLASTPVSSPLVRRKPDPMAPNCKSADMSNKNWLFPRIKREVGETRLSVTNFDLNAVSPTSW